MIVTPFRRLARPRPPRRARLLAATVPLSLAGLIVPAAASIHASATTASRAAHARTASQAPARGHGLIPLSLPGLRARTATVTLITGDQVRLTEVAPGRYDATGIPGRGPASSIDFDGKGGPQGLSSLQALPDEADGLLSSGAISPGVFDVLWLARHGDTEPSAVIPVTIQYPGQVSAAALTRKAARLTGATVTGVEPASREVSVRVPAPSAGAFWAALTRRDASATAMPGPAGAAPPALAGGAAEAWLTGHDTTASNPSPQQTGQPVYPVTLTFTRTVTGSLVPQPCLSLTGMGTPPAALLCQSSVNLLGIDGVSQGTQHQASSFPCVRTEAATPYPLCTAWQATFTVPAGVYAEQSSPHLNTTQDADGTEEKASAELDIPQFTVTGPTAITINTNTITPVTVTTPRPARPYGPDSFGFTRETPDGSFFNSITETVDSQAAGNFWALPTPASERATIGSYNFFDALTMGAPLVTARVTGPQPLTLHPLYDCDAATSNPQGGNCGSFASAFQGFHSMVRFSGSHTYQVVNAGQGTPADFAKIDARGKLALIYPYFGSCNPGPWPAQYCRGGGTPQLGALAEALKAGAAGALFVPGDVGYGGDGCCWAGPLPLKAQPLGGPGAPAVPLPYAAIDQQEAATLAGLLAKSPVSVQITDYGETPYDYQLSFAQEGGIAASQHYTLTTGQLAEVTDTYHAAASLTGPQESLAGNYPDLQRQALTIGSGWSFTGPPFSVRTYYGPVSPDETWLIPSPTVLTAPPSYQTQYSGNVGTVFGVPGQQDMGWHAAPSAPGAFTPDPAVDQARPGAAISVAAASRQGNTLYPFLYLTSGANPLEGEPPVGFAPGQIHLYGQGGQELPASTLGGSAYYPGLPAGLQRYKLETDYQTTEYGTTATTNTTWDFTSAEQPSGDAAPDGFDCWGTLAGTSTAPCNVPPLVFLRYNANTSLDNTLTAPGSHLLQVTGYHQDPAAPPVTSLNLWLSTDSGTTWQPAHVTGGHGGTRTVSYDLPQLSQTNGYLSIKATATDAAGNDITQTILDAVKLAAATSGQAAPNGK